MSGTLGFRFGRSRLRFELAQALGERGGPPRVVELTREVGKSFLSGCFEAP